MILKIRGVERTRQAIQKANINNFLGRAVLVFVSTMITVILFEAVIHMVEAIRGPLFPGGNQTLKFMEGHPVLGWVHKPNISQHYGWPEHPNGNVEIRTNNLGLRENDDTSIYKPDQLYRILVLGDSHTDGLLNNHESWPNLLEQSLNKRSSGANEQSYEVLNAGVSGYQPIQEYLWWRQYGKQLQPDLVILGYYLGNDMIAAGGRRLARQANGKWMLNDAPLPDQQESWRINLRRQMSQLRQACRLCALASYGLYYGLLEGPTREESQYVLGSTAEERSQHLRSLRFCRGCVWQSLEQAWLLERAPTKYEANLAATEEILRRLRDEVEMSKATFIVLIIPSKLQIEGDRTGQAERTAELLNIALSDPLFEERVHSDILTITKMIGIPTIEVHSDLAETFVSDGEPLYYDSDWHLNVKGNHVIGEALYRTFVETSGFLQ